MAETLGTRLKRTGGFRSTVAEPEGMGWSKPQIRNFMEQTEAVGDQYMVLATLSHLTIDQCKEYWSLCRHHNIIRESTDRGNATFSTAMIGSLKHSMSTSEFTKFLQFLNAAVCYIEQDKDPNSGLNQWRNR